MHTGLHGYHCPLIFTVVLNNVIVVVGQWTLFCVSHDKLSYIVNPAKRTLVYVCALHIFIVTIVCLF